MKTTRAGGILIHLTSLPGSFGIGDLESAVNFLNFLKKAGQSCWQFLPTGPGADVFGQSPYMTLSAMAGNPLLISPQQLVDDSLIDNQELSGVPTFSEYTVDFSKVSQFKEAVLRSAYRNFLNRDDLQDSFKDFCASQSWLDDYSLYMSLREKHDQMPWFRWPKKIARRDPDALSDAAGDLSDAVKYHKFVQFVFFRQWSAFRHLAAESGIKLIGDIPIYVGLDSADVWANQKCFDLDSKTLRPLHVAGVPPDYFSKTGQRWGNPLYLWDKGGDTGKQLYGWWKQRFAVLAQLVDVVRIDHFRGFESYWQIPATEKTAVNGKWVAGPGIHFFEKVGDAISNLEIIAEDLGTITLEVLALRDSLGYPGMKILQFAFDSDAKNLYLPHNFETSNCIVYTGTHDNDTTVGWYLDENVAQESKDRMRRYANCDGTAIHKDCIRLAYSSVAKLAIIPMQDVLGFGSDCRMNTPSTNSSNWIWRCAREFIRNDVAEYLRREIQFYGRGRR
ncbi:MAG: 4-alpha-glucanotransferase [Desulfobulbaceae bacterium]|uniref:4-alpha-glucanotransferase n=1 Tax=Candidatus Desulfobia pelagia TaxID=2841692 RepID=A0A8J6TFZ4_9BACT|nr:4-alpha-glucanotransferase [Candidatus Desulfobia pelagia]